MSNQRQAVIILGMHRGGTSALAGAVTRLGLHPPNTPLPPTPDNPTGYFESKYIVSANQHILAAVGCDWNDCLHFDLMAAQRWLGPQRQAQMVAALRHEFGYNGSFVLKDPRLCVLLPLWRPALAAIDAEPHVLIIARHPVEIYRSLADREAIGEDTAAALWLFHMLEAERLCRDVSRAFLLYDGLVDGGGSVLGEAGRIAGITWPRSLGEAAAEVAAFLTAAIRRQNAEQSSAAIGALAIRHLVAMTWLALQRLAHNPADSTALYALDHALVASAWLRSSRSRN
jgi:hypothetical protein